MKDYWVGVFTGLCCAIIFTVVLCFSAVQEVRNLKTHMAALEEHMTGIEGIVEEDRQIMQTYKFFNQSWQAIIDMAIKED